GLSGGGRSKQRNSQYAREDVSFSATLPVRPALRHRSHPALSRHSSPPNDRPRTSRPSQFSSCRERSRGRYREPPEPVNGLFSSDISTLYLSRDWETCRSQTELSRFGRGKVSADRSFLTLAERISGLSSQISVRRRSFETCFGEVRRSSATRLRKTIVCSKK